MRRFVLWIVALTLRFSFWFRYKIDVKGLEKIDAQLKRNPTGILFLPNHVAVFLDPLMIAVALWPHYEARPLIVDYMYTIPGFNFVLRCQNALSVPNMDNPNTRVTRAEIDAINAKIVEGLRQGDNFQLYPAGRLKTSPLEVIGGASMVHSIVQQYPECNIVLVRVKGLWGSSFSKAYTGDVLPDMAATIWNGIKHVFKNFIFFTPRRHVIVEFEPIPQTFPRHAPRRTFNKWLEDWYNQPDGLKEQKELFPGESFIPVSFSIWRDVFPENRVVEGERLPPIEIPGRVKEAVLAALEEVAKVPREEIHLHMSLGSDLGMDSLELVDVLLIIQKQLSIKEFPYHDIKTVQQLMDRIARIA